jgi:outer membrane protein OmpA-like peptidoglycan-associated protein
VFDSASVDTADSAAKGVLVEMADAASGPWSPLANLTLKNAVDKQAFSVPAKVGRYLRLTLLSNFGSSKYVELMGIAAYGNQLTQTPPPKVTGTYEGDFGPFRLMQEGVSASGCYEHKEGLIENGGFDGRVLRFTWSESSGQNQPRDKGAALLIFPGDGSTFTGYWWNEGGKGAPAGDWKGKRINANVGTCPHWSPKGNGVAQQLKRDGRARLYGILFDTDSDRIKPESKPTLDSLIAAAKDNAAWKLRIEGHTDNTGGAAYNQTLSQKRAESVKAYLVTAGIAAARLESAGLGATQPVASNDTTAGRSQNRRVEVVLK